MRKRQMLATPLLWAAWVACTPAFAQSQESRKTTELNPIVVTGTGTFRRAENSPVAVKVITAKELKDAQVTSLTDALTRLTTHLTTHTSGMGKTVNFNGMHEDYMLLLVNGKRVMGDDRWDRVSLHNVKRIEILSGAAGALYGSDALAGVINVITDEGANSVELSERTRLTSKGRFDQEIDADLHMGKWSSNTSYVRHQANSWQVNKYQAFEEGEKVVPKLTGRPMSVGFGSDYVSQRLEWKPNEQWSIYARGDYYNYLTNRPQGATYFTQKATTNKATGEKTYTYSEKQAYTYDLHHHSYTYGTGARWTPHSRVHIYLDMLSDNFSSKYAYWATSKAEDYEQTRKRTHYYNESLKGIFRLNSWNKLSAGAEFIQEYLNSQSDNIDSEHTFTYNLFAQDELQIVKGLEAVAGVRYTYNNLFGSHFTPNLGLFYHMGGWRVRASYAGGYRTPSLSQLYATDQAKTSGRFTINNTDLKPEKNHSWNANVEYSNSWMSVGVGGFINHVRDMINYRTLPDAEIAADAQLAAIKADGWATIRQRDNIDRASLKGLSANVKFILPTGFTVAGGYTFTDSNAKSVSLDKKTQKEVTSESPVDKSVRNVGSVNLTWDRAWGNYHLNVNLNGHIQSRRYSSTYGYAPAYQQWDLNTSHTFTLRSIVLEPGIGIENLFNRKDKSYWNSNYSTIHPGRCVYASLAVRMRK